MRLALTLRLLARDTRGSRSRLGFFVLCLSVGVAAVVAVAGLSASIQEGLRAQARELLAADLVVRSSKPLPEQLDARLRGLGALERTDTREMATLVARSSEDDEPGRSQLVELEAIDGRYPFYGELALDPPRPLEDLLDPEGAVASPELLQRLGLAVGDELRIGSARFVLRGLVLAEPERNAFTLALGPRVFVSGAGLARADLERFGSRIAYRALVRFEPSLPPEALREAARTLRESLPEPSFLRVETHVDGQPRLRRSVERVESYLGLVALLSLVVGGIGVAQTVRSWIASRAEPIAVLQALGMRPREVLALHVAESALLALLGSAVGVVLGSALQLAVPVFARDYLPPQLVRPWQPAALARGLALGLGVALVFALPPLLGILRVPPSLVLRRDAQVLRAGRAARAAGLALVGTGILGTAWVQSRSLGRAASFTAAVVLGAALLALAARLLMRAAGGLPRARFGLVLRHGFAALARPGAGTVGGVVALGLGTMLVLALHLVQRGLADELSSGLPPDAPTAFLFDVQPDQWPALEELLARRGASHVASTPVVVARLAAVDGRAVDELVRERAQSGGARWVLTREQRLTYGEGLPRDNALVAGALWSDPERAEVSLEAEFARDLRVGLGARLVFDVQGRPIEVVVTSLRSVEWRSLGINFFVLVEPGVLEEAPQWRLVSARVPAALELPLQDEIAGAFPNVTMVRVRELAEKIAALLERIGLGVRLLGTFTVLAGVAILAGAIGASAARRAREVALLGALGATRLEIAAMHATEHALLGLLAGAIGAAGGATLAQLVLARWLELDVPLALGPVLTAAVSTALLGVVAGVLASRRALATPPIAVLREA